MIIQQDRMKTWSQKPTKNVHADARFKNEQDASPAAVVAMIAAVAIATSINNVRKSTLHCDERHYILNCIPRDIYAQYICSFFFIQIYMDTLHTYWYSMINAWFWWLCRAWFSGHLLIFTLPNLAFSFHVCKKYKTGRLRKVLFLQNITWRDIIPHYFR